MRRLEAPITVNGQVSIVSAPRQEVTEPAARPAAEQGQDLALRERPRPSRRIPRVSDGVSAVFGRASLRADRCLVAFTAIEGLTPSVSLLAFPCAISPLNT